MKTVLWEGYKTADYEKMSAVRVEQVPYGGRTALLAVPRYYRERT